MAQVLMPNSRPTQLDALTTALNIGQAIYGIKYKAEEMEREKIAANEESEIKALERSKLYAEAQTRQKQAVIDDKMARGEFTPLQLPKFLKESNLTLSDKPTSIKVKVGENDVYLKPAEDLEKEKLGYDIAGKKLDIQSKQLDLASKKQEGPKKQLDYEIALEDLKNKRKLGEKTSAEIGKIVKENLIKRYNQYESESAGFALRMTQAEDDINRVLKSGYNPASIDESIKRMAYYPEALKNELQKSYEQAQRTFINSILRRESGSTITDPEFINARKQYFPQAGDNKEVIEQKRIGRQNATEGLKFASAGAYDDLLSTQAPTSLAKRKESSFISDATASEQKPKNVFKKISNDQPDFSRKVREVP